MTLEEKILTELRAHGDVLQDINDRLGTLERNSALVNESYAGLTQRLAKLEERCFRRTVAKDNGACPGDD